MSTVISDVAVWTVAGGRQSFIWAPPLGRGARFPSSKGEEEEERLGICPSPPFWGVG